MQGKRKGEAISLMSRIKPQVIEQMSVGESAKVDPAPAAELVALPVPVVPLDQHPVAIYLARLRPNGRRAMRYALTTIAAIATGQPNADPLALPWHSLRYQHTAAIAAALRERYKPATVNLMLSALRGVLSEAENLGLLSAEEYRRATRLKAVRGESLPKGRALKSDELAALLKVCRADRKEAPLTAARDAALVALLYSTGLRRSEAVKLDLADYNSEEGSLLVRGGKGGKDRLTYLAETGAQPIVAEWLNLRGEEAGPLFLPINKAGRLARRRLSDQAVLYILDKRAKAAGVAAFSPHDLRRTFVSDLLDAGADLATVQKLAGHASVTTTARYDRRGEKAKRQATALLKLPSSAE